ncbi:TetR/AcrR family transcriptional regulator [Acidiphilium multivorum]|uniref:TetR/AcrR family transcriptional regulator n=1 Tax=Acidiphilium multivorum TaxID=62140 RepID=UPI001F4C282F|nr:TetR/AcrR family transcriptional regulator [Acidiphilium multivorum]
MPEQATAKRKRISKHPDVRREELLQAASVLFEKNGVSATSIGDITDSINVARGTFYLYFTSKDDVIAELWKRYVAGFLSDMKNNSNGEDRQGSDSDPVLDFLEHLTHHALDHAHLHRLVYGTADAAAIAVCKQSDEAILARLTDIIKAYFRQEQLTDRDADLLASLIFHGLDGALHRAIMPGVPINQTKFVSEVKRFAAGALGLSVKHADSHRK